MKPIGKPERLLADSDDPFDADLLAAAREDQPPGDLELRILKQVAAAPPPDTGWKTWAKLGAGTAVVVAVGAALWAASAPDAQRPPPVPSAVVATPTAPPVPSDPSTTLPTAPAPSVVAAPALPPSSTSPEPSSRHATAPTSASSSARPVVHPAPSAAEHAAPSASSAAEHAAPTDGLAGEIATLDSARTAAAAGDHPRALAELDRYARTYPRGTLSQEATMQRIDVLMRAGRVDEARKLGHAFLSANPATPHRKRVHTLMKEGE